MLIHDAATRRVELFDLAKDPKGLTAAASPPAGLEEELLAVLTANDLGLSDDATKPPPPHQLDEQLERQLKALGYVGVAHRLYPEGSARNLGSPIDYSRQSSNTGYPGAIRLISASGASAPTPWKNWFTSNAHLRR